MWNIRSKIAPFSNEHHFEIWFPKKKTITFFWSKLSKLHKKDPILLVATTFCLKQGETITSHGPIPHPLKVSHLGFVLFIGHHTNFIILYPCKQYTEDIMNLIAVILTQYWFFMKLNMKSTSQFVWKKITY